MPTSTRRIQEIYDTTAPRYDRQVAFWERVLFDDGREWACREAKGDIIETAVGTGRNLSHYPQDVRITPIDVSRAMLGILDPLTRLIGGDHLVREPAADVAAARFEMAALARSELGIVERLLTTEPA